MIRIAWHESYAHPLPEGHRFPMVKYSEVPRRLLQRGVLKPEQLFAPEPATLEDMCRVHSPEYIDLFLNAELPPSMVRRIGFPLSPELVDRERRIAMGTAIGAAHALQHGLAFNVAGGTHHAFADRGEAYCLLNDVAVGAAYALQKLNLERVLIIDLDVHQGNGTAAIFEQHPQVFTFSMHEGKAWPPVKQRSHRDVELPRGMEGAAYLDLLHNELNALQSLVQPQLVFFISGVDVLAGDRLGGLALSPEDCRLRDRMVFEWCRSRNIPCVTAMGGGYNRDVDLVIEAHCATFEEGLRAYAEQID